MILVTLGTQKQSFERLLKYVEDCNLSQKIVVQAGYTDFKSDKMEIIKFVSYDKMEKLIEKADFIITHGGTGSIMLPLKKGEKVIACARLKKYGEHVDDHQREIILALSSAGYILELNEEKNLETIISKIDKFKPKKYKSNTKIFLKNLENKLKN